MLNLIIGLLFLNGWQTKIIVGMSLLYAVNQYFQSFGALSVVKVNAPWFHVKERGVFGGIFGIMISSGYFLALTVGGWILASMAWYWVFLIPSCCIAIMFVVDYVMVKDRPSQAGFANFDTGDATSKDADQRQAGRLRLPRAARVQQPVILTIIVAEFCTGFVRQGVLLWFVPFLKEVHDITAGVDAVHGRLDWASRSAASSAACCADTSRTACSSRGGPRWRSSSTSARSSRCCARLQPHRRRWRALLIPFTCMWIFGVHGMLSATSAMDFGGTKAAATVTGICDGVQYLASGLTGFCLGGALDKYGWGVWTWMIIPFSVFGALLMTRLWNETPLEEDARGGQGGLAGAGVTTVELHRHFEAGIRPETIARLAARHGLTEVRTRRARWCPASTRRIRTPSAATTARWRPVSARPAASRGSPTRSDFPLSVLRSLEDLEDGGLRSARRLRRGAAACTPNCAARRSATRSTSTRRSTRSRPRWSTAWIARGRSAAVSGTFILAFSRQKGLGPPDAPPVQRQAAVVARLAARLHRPDRPVGLDIAGFPEATFPPRVFEEALAPAREAGVPLTVHAGEQGRPPDFLDAPPALIVEAVERLGARRIGHGTSLAASSGARRLMRERGVAVECCPVSNAKMGFMPIAQHPLPLLLREGLLVSLSTDDPLMFGPFTVSETFDAIAAPLGLSEADLLALTQHGIESAFVSDSRRAWLRRQLDDRLRANP